MLFQYGGTFTNVFYDLQQWGIFDILIPFILIFTILYAVLEKAAIFSEKRYNSIIALAITLIVIIPHILGSYPPGMDVINIINSSLPEVVLLIVAVVMLMIMTGLAYGEYSLQSSIGGLIALVSAILLILIFASNYITVPILSYIDPQLQSIIVIIIVFLIVFWYVTKETPTTTTSWADTIENWFKSRKP